MITKDGSNVTVLGYDQNSEGQKIYSVIVDEITWSVPDDETNRYRGYVDEWKEEGNSVERIAKNILGSDLDSIIQSTMERFATDRGYKDAITLMSYATSRKEKWRNEAQKLIDFRDDAFEYMFNMLEKGPVTDIDKFREGLPELK